MAVIDSREVREHAMTLYWQLKKYEDTGLTPEQLKVIDEEYSRMAKELSMLRQQNQWIPVSVELPDVPIGTGDEECPEFNVMIKDACRPTTLKYAPDGAWFDDLGEVYEVVAWMPLPEPYKEGEEIE
ncbi:hypothetical protein [Frisingicoccus sp.]|uniref:hypothetical protein n=1 Tax=Frisingicoccus sp. TaxID=1918627 RepID=UPI003AB5E48C